VSHQSVPSNQRYLDSSRKSESMTESSDCSRISGLVVEHRAPGHDGKSRVGSQLLEPTLRATRVIGFATRRAESKSVLSMQSRVGSLERPETAGSRALRARVRRRMTSKSWRSRASGPMGGMGLSRPGTPRKRLAWQSRLSLSGHRRGGARPRARPGGGGLRRAHGQPHCANLRLPQPRVRERFEPRMHDALETLRTALTIGRERRLQIWDGSVLAIMAAAYVGLGDRAKALATAEQALAVCPRRGARLWEFSALLTRSRALREIRGLQAVTEIAAAFAEPRLGLRCRAPRATSPSSTSSAPN
jgi:hypothetical protein